MDPLISMIKNRLPTVLMILSISSLAQASLSKATSSSGMASTAHPLATHAAQSIYKIGGNSIDAAIAASLTLSVVEPSMSGLGGRAQAIVRYPDGRFQGYNGMTEIPRGFVVQSKMANSGYATVATPGLLALLQVLHENHGSLPFQRLIQPAIKYAQKGFTVLPGEASRHQRSVKKIKQNPNHIIHVAIDANKIVGSTTLFIEQKFIHDSGLVGHIEDVVVRKDYEDQGIGMNLVNSLLDVAKQRKCYKTILNCEDSLKPFYEKIGFKKATNEMRYDHN